MLLLLLTHIPRADPSQTNANGQSPLYAACASGHVTLIEILAAKSPAVLRTADVQGRTCLHAAIQSAANFEEVNLNPNPQTPNPKPQTPNPKPQTPNPKPQTGAAASRESPRHVP